MKHQLKKIVKLIWKHSKKIMNYNQLKINYQNIILKKIIKIIIKVMVKRISQNNCI